MTLNNINVNRWTQNEWREFDAKRLDTMDMIGEMLQSIDQISKYQQQQRLQVTTTQRCDDDVNPSSVSCNSNIIHLWMFSRVKNHQKYPLIVIVCDQKLAIHHHIDLYQTMFVLNVIVDLVFDNSFVFVNIVHHQFTFDVNIDVFD